MSLIWNVHSTFYKLPSNIKSFWLSEKVLKTKFIVRKRACILSLSYIPCFPLSFITMILSKSWLILINIAVTDFIASWGLSIFVVWLISKITHWTKRKRSLFIWCQWNLIVSAQSTKYREEKAYVLPAWQYVTRHCLYVYYKLYIRI